MYNDQGRTNHLNNLKESKSRSFAHKFNERNHQINQSNIKFLDKLERVRPYHRHTTYASADRIPTQPQPPTRQRKQSDTIKENSRIYTKLKSVSSSLNHDKMMQEYAKTQRIKDRIQRFTSTNSRVSLKYN